MTGTPADSAVTPFDEVYRDHADAVFRFCASQLRNLAVAEDVTADVFASAFAAYPGARPDPDGVRPWLFRIARNAVIDQYRRDGRRRTLLVRLGRDRDYSSSVETDAERRGAIEAIVAALQMLGERDRQLVGLRTAAGLSFAEVGAVLGMKEQSAKVATHRALAKLRARLEGTR
ncbi:MAG: sigma-70 family RNA polymerase sigma factor [Candidatus Dormibacteraeota bacterium]|nr:sigma-70 family RNA polymerase sigma factor [Candidatus Dormibacteraeota bacterium]